MFIKKQLRSTFFDHVGKHWYIGRIHHLVQSTFCKSCFPLQSQPKGQKEKKTIFPFYMDQIFGCPVRNLFEFHLFL